LLCPAGYYQYSYTSSHCIACENGKISAVGALSASQCIQCSPGQYISQGGSCQDCPAGYFQDVLMQSSCKSCPSYRGFSEVGASSSDLCGCSSQQRYQVVLDYGEYIQSCSACPEGYQSDPTPHWNPNYCASIDPPVGLQVVHYKSVSSVCGHAISPGGRTDNIPGTTNFQDGDNIASFGYINGVLQYGTTLRLKYKKKNNGAVWKNSKIPCVGGLIDQKWYDASPIRSPLALYLIHEPPSSADPGCCGSNNCGYNWYHSGSGTDPGNPRLRSFEISIESC